MQSSYNVSKRRAMIIAQRKAQRARELMCAFARVSNPKKDK